MRNTASDLKCAVSSVTNTIDDISLAVFPERSNKDFPVVDCRDANLNEPVNHQWTKE